MVQHLHILQCPTLGRLCPISYPCREDRMTNVPCLVGAEGMRLDKLSALLDWAL